MDKRRTFGVKNAYELCPREPTGFKNDPRMDDDSFNNITRALININNEIDTHVQTFIYYKVPNFEKPK